MAGTRNMAKHFFKKHSRTVKSLSGVFALDMGIELASGRTMGQAVRRATLESFMYEMFPSIGLPYMVGRPMLQAAVPAVQGRYHNTKNFHEDMYRANLGGNFVDTEATHTMRQRGVQAIENNRLNARSALGNTARMMHRR